MTDIAVAVLPLVLARTLAVEPPRVAPGDMASAHPVRRTAPLISWDVVRERGVCCDVRRDPARGAVADVAVPVLPARPQALIAEVAGVALLNVPLAHPVRLPAPKRSRNILRVVGVGGIRLDPARRAVADVAVPMVPMRSRAFAAEVAGVTLSDIALAHPVRLTSPKRSRNICGRASSTTITRQW